MAIEEQTEQERHSGMMQAQAAPDVQTVEKTKPSVPMKRAAKGRATVNTAVCPLPPARSFAPRAAKSTAAKNMPASADRPPKKNCPNCQNIVAPYACQNCGAKTLNPVCACGEILDKKVQAMQAVQAE
jgi:hypothetical protein